MANKCNPKCIYFPLHSYEREKENYKRDKHGTKHNSVKAFCMYDDHLITGWDFCNNYKTQLQVKQIPDKEKIVMLLGKSSAGKDYTINFLKQNYNFTPIISHTTRPMRDGERDGVDYHFVNTQVFSKMIMNEEFVETREYNTKFNGKPDIWFYGTSKEELEEGVNKICAVDNTGLQAISKYYGKQNIVVIYISVEDDTREERAKLRGSFSQTEWDRRLKDDNKKFKNIEYDYLLDNNGSKEELEENIVKILKKEGLI